MDTSLPSDAALIARVLTQRDQHAFRQLVLRYQSPVRRWARRLCNGDLAAADDLAQEVFLKAYRSLDGFRGQARFSTWLYRITFNLAVSQKRLARERWVQVELPDVEDEVKGGHAACTHAESAEVQRDLASAMHQLAQAQQWALRLSLEEGMSHEEIASIMDIPLGTVKTHLLRGKQKLRDILSHWREKA